MNKPTITETHERKIWCEFRDNDLKQLLLSKACQVAGIQNLTLNGLGYPPPGYTVKILIEDATEGSPAYKVGNKATVTIVQDLTFVAEGSAAPVLSRSPRSAEEEKHG